VRRATGSERFARWARVTLAVPGMLTGAYERSRAALESFDRLLPPILEATIPDRPTREHVRGSLRAWSVKGNELIGGFSAMACIRHPVDTAVLGSAFARLYDDLLDESAGHRGLASRLAVLFDGGEFHPADDLERLLGALYESVAARLGRPRSDPIFDALTRLHAYQSRSLAQRGDRLSTAELDEITREKGGLSLTVLCCLARPSMSAEEAALIGDVGATLQLLDDYTDREVDRRNAVRTPVTLGQVGRAELERAIAGLEPALREFYGAGAARRFLGEFYLLMLIASVPGRRTHESAARRGRSGAGLPILVLRGPSTVLSEYADG
jgi:hypothetical protein